MKIADAKRALPWQLKLASKVVLARLPASYRFWQSLELFKHGAMAQPDYAFEVFRRHFDRSDFAGKSGGFVSLEIGPGDSLFSCVIAKALGGSQTYLVDAGSFVREEDTAPCREMADYLREQGLEVVPVNGTLKEVLVACGGHYLTQGLGSLETIASESVDWIWSQAVLEHIRKAEFLPYMRELRRIIKADGVCSHRVDLRDHLGGGLNNLRFSEKVWESEWMANSGFYTNRIRYSEMCNLFADAGFAVEVLGVDRWDRLPLSRKKLSDAFQEFSDEELRVSGFDVILRPH